MSRLAVSATSGFTSAGQFRGVPLAELSPARVDQAFASLFRDGMSEATARRLFSVLRSALNAAAREGLVSGNPCRYVKLPEGRRPHAVIWTRRRVAEWKRTGVRPAVAVWTAEQTAVFLAAVGRASAVRRLPPDGGAGAAPGRGVRAAVGRHRAG
jgi:hypothetical protein